jgi:hypothetical protein
MRGVGVPGWKLVRGVTHRKIKDMSKAILAAKTEIGKDAFAPTKLKTPAQLAKLGKKGTAFVAKWGYKPEGPVTTAPADDSRPALDLGPSPIDTFGDMV